VASFKSGLGSLPQMVWHFAQFDRKKSVVSFANTLEERSALEITRRAHKRCQITAVLFLALARLSQLIARVLPPGSIAHSANEPNPQVSSYL
jgi:hypothetical protein